MSIFAPGQVLAFFQQGGIFMYLILLSGAVATAVSIERYVVLYLKSSMAARAFVNKVCNHIKSGDLDQAVKLTRAKKTPLSRIVGAAVAVRSGDERDIQNAVDEAALSEIPILQDRTPYLATIAQIATLLGLLGTIVGLMQSFSAVQGAASEQRAMLLAAGISTALNTTALGLIVAVPTTVAYSVLQRKTERLVEQIDEASVRVMNLLTARQRTAPAVAHREVTETVAAGR
jgi:biopolymer transport protein ExbB/TolQ